MKKSLRLVLFLAATAVSGLASAVGLWGKSSAPAQNTPPRPAAPQIQVQAPGVQTPAARKAPATPAPAVKPGARPIARDGEYTDKESLCRYIIAYGTLPRNFITKAEARRLGWTGGPIERYAPGKSIGGDRFGNYEHVLPNGRYRECDVDTRARPRGAKRLVFSDDKRIYYSSDHYRTFQRLH